MNEKDFNEQEYLKACLIRDMLNAKGMVATYVNITEVMKKEKEKLQQEVEDWKYKCSKMDDEMCELKKENVRLNEKVQDIEDQNLKLQDEICSLSDTIKTQESDILKLTMQSIGKEVVKRGRPPKGGNQ